ncbi:TPR repeat [Rothia aeria]|uniref:TPR repeat n=1 Tax=Rothia aeria TaxID=172042 RepID=A0A2Z5R183_9MICC|nr:TPR repeat [Rothia aeria]
MTEPNKPLEQMTVQERFDLGRSYYNEGKFDEAIKIWSNISHDDDPGTYAQAQLGLGAAYCTQIDLVQAVEAWSNISHDDDPEAYARAQFNLGLVYAQSKLEQAIKNWSSITRDDDPKAYVEAQLCLGEVYSLDKEKEEQAHKAYNNVCDFSYYKSERGFKILKCPVVVRKNLHNLAKNTDEVLKSLQIIPEFESKVAHYSRPSTAFSLFGDEKNNRNPSNFRLSTIRGVNDPTEGLILRDYWEQQGISETIHTNDTATFISCFTFNHDSLNQFRLYGKENGQEATGVSLVFNKEFFSDQSDDLKFIAGPSTDPSSKSEQIKLNDTGKPESDNKKQLIAKSALYRCIYLDPETGYWTLAQRNKSTFYRENKDKDTAENNWETYSEKISEIEKSFKDSLFDNNDSVLSKLKSIFKYPNTYGIEEKQKILETVRFILLPCNTSSNILPSGRNRNAALCILLSSVMRRFTATVKNRKCTSSMRSLYCHISIRSGSPLVQRRTKISSASCSIKVVVKARFVSPRTRLGIKNKSFALHSAGQLPCLLFLPSGWERRIISPPH